MTAAASSRDERRALRARDARRAQSSKTRREDPGLPLFNEVPGAIASLLAARARSVPARGRRREEQPNQKKASPEASPCEPRDATSKWQVHASRLQQLLRETDCELVAENTFLSVSAGCGSAPRSRSAPGQVDGRLETASGAATPEVWEREVSQEQNGMVHAVVSAPRASRRCW
ncbi:unnamed protein product [Effrenium voratum]|nr:unnamed protein product [Effrenium voratum]